MRTLKLKDYLLKGVQELDVQEKKKIQGGKSWVWDPKSGEWSQKDS